MDKLCVCTSHRFIENHEFDMMLLKDPFKEFESETGQPVSVGNHNLRDFSSEDEFQNSPEAWALPVDAGTDVRDDSVLGKFGSHEFDLTCEVISLTVRTDSAVDDVDAFWVGSVFGSIESVGEELIDVVMPLVPRRAIHLNVAGIRPLAEGRFGDPEALLCNTSRDKLTMHRLETKK